MGRWRKGAKAEMLSRFFGFGRSDIQEMPQKISVEKIHSLNI
jgi:hypothetical protein